LPWSNRGTENWSIDLENKKEMFGIFKTSPGVASRFFDLSISRTLRIYDEMGTRITLT